MTITIFSRLSCKICNAILQDLPCHLARSAIPSCKICHTILQDLPYHLVRSAIPSCKVCHTILQDLPLPSCKTWYYLKVCTISYHLRFGSMQDLATFQLENKSHFISNKLGIHAIPCTRDSFQFGTPTAYSMYILQVRLLFSFQSRSLCSCFYTFVCNINTFLVALFFECCLRFSTPFLFQTFGQCTLCKAGESGRENT